MRAAGALLAALPAAVLMGCAATSGLSPEGERAFFEAQREAADRPLFTLACPATGCVISSLTVHDPSGRGVQVLPAHSPGADMGREILRALTSISPWLVLGDVAKTGIRSAQGDTAITTTTTTTSHETTSGDTYGDGATQVDGDYNTGRIDSPDDHSTRDAVFPPAAVQGGE